MYEYAGITGYKPDRDGTHLKIFIPDRHLEEAIVKKRIKDCMIWLDDGRHISAEQRKKAYATIRDIADFTGYAPEEMKERLKLEHIIRTGCKEFSLSDCTMDTAREFINTMLDLALEMGIPLMDFGSNRTDDIDHYLWACLKNRRCAICGRYGEIHHVDSIGMGNDREKVNDSTVKSPNHSGRRTHRIDRITPHCVVGQLSAESIGGCFPAGRGASCNYGIGKDGRVCLIVDEENRSWCSSSNSNDQRAVTIECASDMKDPYAMTNAVYEKLIELCVDICRRNGKTTLLWFADKNKSLNYEPKANEMVLTVHRWFANKSCPGDWLYSRLGDVASRVTSQLGGSSGGGSNSGSSGSYKTGLYKVNVGDLNIRKGPGTNYGINGVITNKGTYTIVEIKNGSWGRLKSGAGWINISSAYCSYVGATSGGGSSNNGSGSAGSNSKTGTYKVDIPDLYIRKGPGTGYAKNGFCPKGVYTIVETKSANGYTWGRLKSGAGWIALDYAKKV